MANILLIDDDDDLSDYLCKELKALDHAVECLDRAEHGLDRLAEARFDLVVLDNKMPRITGLEFLEVLRDRKIEVPVILMTGSPSSATAIRATKFRAFQYVIKPDDYRSLVAVLRSAIEKVLASSRENAQFPTARFAPRIPAEPSDEPVLVGNSKPMLEVYSRIGLFAAGGYTVLIRGETGTGKELVAKAVHNESARKEASFVPVNCGAIAPHLAESELFGHKKGAFTGADRDREGLFEVANGGTLFFDEIGDMPLELQVKLLRVLQKPVVVRVGTHEPIKVDVRVLAATHRDLPRMVREGTFREDLYYRLDRFVIPLPPLRERLEDLPELVDGFLARAAQETGRPRPAIAEATLERFRAYRWPGNVRQLENVISRAFGLCQGPVMLPVHVEFPPDGTDQPTAATPASEAQGGLLKAIAWAWDAYPKKVWPRLHDQLERELLKVALERFAGNQTKVAEWLGMNRGTVIKRMEEHGLRSAD